MKIPNAIKYSFFVGKRVIRNAINGIMIPITKEYPLVSHCPVVIVIFKLLIIANNAVVNAVDNMVLAMQLITLQIKIKVLLLFVITLCFALFHFPILDPYT